MRVISIRVEVGEKSGRSRGDRDTHVPESTPFARGLQGSAKVDWVTVWLPALLDFELGE